MEKIKIENKEEKLADDEISEKDDKINLLKLINALKI